jgi:catechol 2,3-dioxygenase-like lactoylglutathione lyase family enzyme
MLQQRLSIITLGVRDLAASRRFYVETLGLTPEDDNEQIVFFQMGGYALALFDIERLAEDISPAAKPPERRGYNGFTLAYNLGSIEEVDALFAQLEAAGVEILKRPEKVFWGGYSGYFADPDGHPWEVAFNPFVVIDEKGRMFPKTDAEQA